MAADENEDKNEFKCKNLYTRTTHTGYIMEQSSTNKRYSLDAPCANDQLNKTNTSPTTLA